MLVFSVPASSFNYHTASPSISVLTATITATVLRDHKEYVVEVPFNPENKWQSKAIRFAPGRFGHAVDGTLNDIAFSSYIIAKSGRFWLLIPLSLKLEASLDLGSTVEVSVLPSGDDA